MVAQCQKGFAALKFAEGFDHVVVADGGRVEADLPHQVIVAKAQGVLGKLGGGDDVVVVIPQGLEGGQIVEGKQGIGGGHRSWRWARGL